MEKWKLNIKEQNLILVKMTEKIYYQKSKQTKSINGNFKIKSFKHGILIQFIEEKFSNQSAKINLILKDTILSYETNRIKQNILSTNIISYSNLEYLEALEIEYNINPKNIFVTL